MVEFVENIDGEVVPKASCQLKEVHDTLLTYECETKHDADVLSIEINQMGKRDAHNWVAHSNGRAVSVRSRGLVGGEFHQFLRDKELV